MLATGSFVVQTEDDEILNRQASDIGLDVTDSFVEMTPQERRQSVATAIKEAVDAYANEIAEKEKTWEERLTEQRARDEEERIEAEKLNMLSNKKAPHLTNLNEDTQLSGKVYYGLSGLAQEPVRIGKVGSDPVPQIALRGMGV